MVLLGEVLKPVSRPEPVDPEKVYALLGAHWYAKGLYVKDTKSGAEVRAGTLYRVERGDFVYNRLFAWMGSFAIADEASHSCYVSNEFPCFSIRPDRLDPVYLWRYFSRSAAWAEALGLSSGGTPTSRNRLKEEKLLGMRIPLPPLTEQRRIVARVEALAGRIAEAKRLREEAAAETEACQHSILDESYASAEKAFGRQMLGAICTALTDGDHLTPTFVSEGVKFIFVGNVSSGFFHFRGCKFVDPAYYRALSPMRKPKRGDILYSAVGATLGIPAIVEVDEPFCFQRHVALIRPDHRLIDSKYLWHILRSGTLFRRAWNSITGTAQPTVPLKAIRSFPVPVPPLDQQLRIVARLDALQAKADSLRALQGETTAELDALLPAVLAQAFAGRL